MNKGHNNFVHCVLMFKKYIPYFLLMFAAAGLLYIKSHQRGAFKDHALDKEEVHLSGEKIIYSKHARCRMECRHIDESEVADVLANGAINYDKIQTDDRGNTYPLEGVTKDGQKVRIVFAPKEHGVVEVVTCIDLETDWP
jgi:hypothetical protein